MSRQLTTVQKLMLQNQAEQHGMSSWYDLDESTKAVIRMQNDYETLHHDAERLLSDLSFAAMNKKSW